MLAEQDLSPLAPTMRWDNYNSDLGNPGARYKKNTGSFFLWKLTEMYIKIRKFT